MKLQGTGTDGYAGMEFGLMTEDLVNTVYVIILIYYHRCDCSPSFPCSTH